MWVLIIFFLHRYRQSFIHWLFVITKLSNGRAYNITYCRKYFILFFLFFSYSFLLHFEIIYPYCVNLILSDYHIAFIIVLREYVHTRLVKKRFFYFIQNIWHLETCQIFSNKLVLYSIASLKRKFYQFWIESRSSLVSVSHLIRRAFAFYHGKTNAVLSCRSQARDLFS